MVKRSVKLFLNPLHSSEPMMKIPVVDIGYCTLCLGCVEVCPMVFSESDHGYIRVAELDVYPKDAVNEAIKYCPEDCIQWESQ